MRFGISTSSSSRGRDERLAPAVEAALARRPPARSMPAGHVVPDLGPPG